MKRAAFTAALILCVSSVLVWMVPQLLLPLGIFGLAGGIGFAVAFVLKRKRWLRDLLFSFICLLLSICFLSFSVCDYYSTAESYEGETVSGTVVLTEDPKAMSTGTYRYTVRFLSGEPFSQEFVFFCQAYLTEAGGTVTAEFTFSEPSDEYFLSNLSEGIVFTAKLETYWEDVEYTHSEGSFTTLCGKVRRYVHTQFLRYIGSDFGGFMTAVLTGDKAALNQEDYTSLQNTGMLHIVAVSGLHVSIFVSFVLFFLQKIRFLRLRLVLSFLSLFLILLFSGFTPSVCRAVIMNGVLFLNQGFSRGSDAFNRLGIAAILILIFSPQAALSLSFELSFAAALGILLLAKPITDFCVQNLFVRHHVICSSVLRSAIGLFSVSVAAFCFTLPLLWLRIGSFSVLSLFLSPMILPVLELCFFAALSLLIFSLIPFLDFLCRFIGALIRYGVSFMTNLAFSASSLLESVQNIPPVLAWIISGALLLGAVVLFFLPASKTKAKRKKKKMIRSGVALLLLSVALLSAYQVADHVGGNIAGGQVAPDTDVLQTVFLDVGQGNCFISILNEQAYVVDCGGTTDPGHTAADYLTSVGIDTIEFVLISHLHSDHANGLVDLCEEKQVKEIIIPYTEGDAALYAKITSVAAEEGAVLTVLQEDSQRSLGNSTLRMLTRHLDPTSDDQNENSIVGLCEYGEFRALFTGDITEDAEERLVSSYGVGLNCDILSVPHHGSKGSSCKSFLQAASPVYAVISVGAKNTYGHPTEAAMSRITAVGATILRTDELSTVVIRTDGEKMEVVSSHES